MNKEAIADFCMRYFTATECQIVERSPTCLKVKLSPEADRDLTGRPYYWNFVERTGATPETMSFMFILDPEARAREMEQQEKPKAATSDSILSRYLGMPPIAPQPGRMIEEPLVFGARRLEQLFQSACEKGSYLQLFEEPPFTPAGALLSVPYSSWLGVNYKVEFICDLKREEIHSLGISLSTGEIITGFHDELIKRKLSPRFPAHTTLRETISLDRAVQQLEQYMTHMLRSIDYSWAREAAQRMNEELTRIDAYYEDLLRASGMEEETRKDIEAQYTKQKEEIHWQYGPRVEVSPINCGFFHLLSDSMRYH